MKWEMEILSPTSYSSNSSWLYEESKSTNWTPAENKAFENALAVFDKDTPDRWQKVADMVPGKTVVDVIKQYRELEDDISSIEAGLVPLPGYSSSPFTLEWGRSSHSCDGFKQSYEATGGGKRSSSSNRPLEQERKKGVPWTEEEHKLFLMGLKKYGKGDWRNISRNYVITRTPTQVASHAQKYFMRQLSGGKDKRRASIHDITTVNLTDNQIPSPPENTKLSSSSSSSPEQRSSSNTAMNNNKMANFQWNNQTNISNGAMMNFSMDHGNVFLYSPNGGNSYDVKNIQSQNLQRGAAINEPYLGCQSMVFQMQSADQ